MGFAGEGRGGGGEAGIDTVVFFVVVRGAGRGRGGIQQPEEVLQRGPLEGEMRGLTRFRLVCVLVLVFSFGCFWCLSWLRAHTARSHTARSHTSRARAATCYVSACSLHSLSALCCGAAAVARTRRVEGLWFAF